MADKEIVTLRVLLLVVISHKAKPYRASNQSYYMSTSSSVLALLDFAS